MGLLDLLQLQKAEAEERLHNPELTTEMREVDQAYLAEIERLIAGERSLFQNASRLA